MDGTVNAAIDVKIAGKRRHIILVRIINLDAQFIRASVMKIRGQLVTKRGKATAVFPEQLTVQIGLGNERSRLEPDKDPLALPGRRNVETAGVPASAPVIAVFKMRLTLVI